MYLSYYCRRADKYATDSKGELLTKKNPKTTQKQLQHHKTLRVNHGARFPEIRVYIYPTYYNTHQTLNLRVDAKSECFSAKSCRSRTPKSINNHLSKWSFLYPYFFWCKTTFHNWTIISPSECKIQIIQFGIFTFYTIIETEVFQDLKQCLFYYLCMYIV